MISEGSCDTEDWSNDYWNVTIFPVFFDAKSFNITTKRYSNHYRNNFRKGYNLGPEVKVESDCCRSCMWHTASSKSIWPHLLCLAVSQHTALGLSPKAPDSLVGMPAPTECVCHIAFGILFTLLPVVKSWKWPCTYFLFCESMLFAQCAQFMINVFLLTDMKAFWFNGFLSKKTYGDLSYVRIW